MIICIFVGGRIDMAYTKASGRAVAKYDKEHYKKVGIKVPLEIWEKVGKCSRYKNTNQFLNMLIMEELRKDGLIEE